MLFKKKKRKKGKRLFLAWREGTFALRLPFWLYILQLPTYGAQSLPLSCVAAEERSALDTWQASLMLTVNTAFEEACQ